jgi:hypothetical protein
MINKKDFIGINYENFKKEAEDLINKYHFSTYYKTDLKDCRVDLDTIMSMTNGSPILYLRHCSLYKFLLDIYNITYVRRIFKFAKDQGFELDLPEEKKDNFDMDKFAVSVLRKKTLKHFLDMNYYFVLSFSKKKNNKLIKVNVPLLDFINERFYVEELFKISDGLNKMEY